MRISSSSQGEVIVQSDSEIKETRTVEVPQKPEVQVDAEPSAEISELSNLVFSLKAELDEVRNELSELTIYNRGDHRNTVNEMAKRVSTESELLSKVAVLEANVKSIVNKINAPVLPPKPEKVETIINTVEKVIDTKIEVKLDNETKEKLEKEIKKIKIGMAVVAALILLSLFI